MSTSWVAGVVRAKAMARRRLGPAGARAVASTGSHAEAVAMLAAGPYGHDVRAGQNLREAEHAIGAAVLWNMRVLAGWLPRSGADLVRLLAAGFELANLDEQLEALAGRPVDPPYVLGTLATAWPRLVAASSVAEIRDVVETSTWHVKSSGTHRDLRLGLRLAWADAVIASVPEAAGWARAASALLIVRDISRAEHLSAPNAMLASRILGSDFVAASAAGSTELHDLASKAGHRTGWVFAGIENLEDLWRAEITWWHRVEQDGLTMLRDPHFGRDPVVGAAAVLAADGWRVRAALATVSAGTDTAREFFDELA